MTDRILSDEEVEAIHDGKGGWSHATGWVFSHATTGPLCTSHRLLAARVKELEEERDDYKELNFQRLCNQCDQPTG